MHYAQKISKFIPDLYRGMDTQDALKLIYEKLKQNDLTIKRLKKIYHWKNQFSKSGGRIL
jgi:rRNA processing protein Krr1/Pno1